MNLRRMLINMLLLPLLPVFAAGFTDYGTVIASHKLNKTYCQGKFLQGKEIFTVFDQFAKRQKNTEIPLNEGDNVEFTRVAPFGMARGALTEGTNPTASKIYANVVTAELVEHGDYVKVSKKFWLTSMDSHLTETANELGKAEAKTIDSLIWEVVAEGGIGLRADADANESGERTITGTSSTTSRIIWTGAMSGLASGDTGVIVFLSGKNYGQVRQFTCDGTSPTLQTVVSPALDHAPTAGDLIRLVTTMGLTTADTVTCEHIRKSVALLGSSGAVPFDDGYYHAVYSPLQKYDFQRDTEWINLKHYAAPKDLYRNLDGEIFGVRFHNDNNPYRHTAGTIGTYVAGGGVYVISIFGKNSFGNVRITGIDNKFYTCPPVADPNNPLAMFGTMGYYALCCPVVLNGCNIVNIFNVPTSF